MITPYYIFKKMSKKGQKKVMKLEERFEKNRIQIVMINHDLKKLDQLESLSKKDIWKTDKECDTSSVKSGGIILNEVKGCLNG